MIILMLHTCQAAIVHCLDFRLQKSIKKYLENDGLIGNCDIISIAGGVKNLNFLLEQVQISKRLHSIKQVILINHTDCGAYGGKAAFASSAEQRTRQEIDLRKAQQMIEESIPGLEVEMGLAACKDTDQFVIESIAEESALAVALRV